MAKHDSVMITDYAWPDVEIERSIVERAGYELLVSPAELTVTDLDDAITTADPAAILTCWAPISAAAIAATTRLRVIARMGVGLDNIDVPAATAAGAWVTNVPDYCTEEVAEHAVALILGLTRGVAAFDRSVRAGAWQPATARLTRLSSRTIGIVGFGRIGRRTAAILSGFGCRVLATSSKHAQDNNIGVEIAPLPTVLAESDVVVIHAPLTDQTRHLIDATALATIKKGAYLINVSRGGLVDTAALIHALHSGHLAGAALDVLEDEPVVDPALLAHPDVIVTPHVAFSSDESLIELRTKAAQEVVRVLGGSPPLNPCNSPD
ncbi:C-terminal binding protein [Gordonia sp. CPCC 205515]|uniref:C-terminal binding protein n=1 Tax=Gordonia sp. CPCC 205515 TaxID=3140791 RepID=UPI003AF39172